MSNVQAIGKVAQDSVKVAVRVGEGIAVHAKGHPARIIAVAAAAGIVTIAVGVGAAAYFCGRALLGRNE